MQNLCGIDERYCPLKWRAVLFLLSQFILLPRSITRPYDFV
jgi:hypothetical protein